MEKKETGWEYHGVSFRFQTDSKGLKKLKAGYTVSTAVLIILWFVFSLTVGIGKEAAAYVGVPWFLQILPMMYLIMGVFGVLRAGSEMTVRDIHAGYYRIRIAKWILLIFQAAAVAGDLVFLVLSNSRISVWEEIIWIISAVLCLTCTVVLFCLQRNYPPYQIPA